MHETPPIKPVKPRPKLAAWMHDRDYSDAAFAELVGSTQQAVNRWTKAFDDPLRTVPSPRFMAKIRQVTAGDVTADDFFEPLPETPALAEVRP